MSVIWESYCKKKLGLINDQVKWSNLDIVEMSPPPPPPVFTDTPEEHFSGEKFFLKMWHMAKKHSHRLEYSVIGWNGLE